MEITRLPPTLLWPPSVSCFAKLLLPGWRRVLKRHHQYPASLATAELSPALRKPGLASEHAKSCLFCVDNFQGIYLPAEVCVDCMLLRDISGSGSGRGLLDTTGFSAGAREALVVPPAFMACSYKLH